MSPTMVGGRPTPIGIQIEVIKKLLGQDFLLSFGNDTKIDVYVDKKILC